MRLTTGRFWILFAVGLALLPWLHTSELYRHLLILTAIHAILALSLNLVTGFTGLLSFGHSAFVAAGAYTSALLTLKGAPFGVGVLAAGAVAFVFGILVGLPTLRVSGIYLGMITWGLAEVVRLVALNVEFTRGPFGLPGIPAITIFGQPLFQLWQIYYAVAVVLLLCTIISTRLAESRIGDALLAVREDNLAAEAMGINTVRLKVLAFGVSATMAGVAGAFLASYLTFISPAAFGFQLSSLMVMMVVVGGLGSIPGALLGAVLLTMLPEMFRFLSDYRLILYGATLIFMMVFRPQGILGNHRHLLQSVFAPHLAATGRRSGGVSDAA